MRDIDAELTEHRIQGARRDEHHRRRLLYADGMTTLAEFRAWELANPIDWSGFEHTPSTPRQPHGGIASVCWDRFT